MLWIELITLLAVIQLAVFGILVSRARVRYKLALPAMAGQPQAERYIRAHLNSVEWLGIFLASLWIAALHWNPLVIAGLGLIYLVGRILYFRGYVRSIHGRMRGFILSTLTVTVLIAAGLVGILRMALGMI